MCLLGFLCFWRDRFDFCMKGEWESSDMIATTGAKARFMATSGRDWYDEMLD